MLLYKGNKRSGWLRSEGIQHPPRPYPAPPRPYPVPPPPNTKSRVKNSLVGTAAVEVSEGFLDQGGSILCIKFFLPEEGSRGHSSEDAWGRSCIWVRAACLYMLPLGKPAWVGVSGCRARKATTPSTSIQNWLCPHLFSATVLGRRGLANFLQNIK